MVDLPECGAGHSTAKCWTGASLQDAPKLNPDTEQQHVAPRLEVRECRPLLPTSRAKRPTSLRQPGDPETIGTHSFAPQPHDWFALIEDAKAQQAQNETCAPCRRAGNLCWKRSGGLLATLYHDPKVMSHAKSGLIAQLLLPVQSNVGCEFPLSNREL